MTKLPTEFSELNNDYIKPFNRGDNVALFGENKYLLLQGSRVKGYSLFLCEGKIGEGKVVRLLSGGLNKKAFICVIELLDRLAMKNTPLQPIK